MVRLRRLAEQSQPLTGTLTKSHFRELAIGRPPTLTAWPCQRRVNLRIWEQNRLLEHQIKHKNWAVDQS